MPFLCALKEPVAACVLNLGKEALPPDLPSRIQGRCQENEFNADLICMFGERTAPSADVLLLQESGSHFVCEAAMTHANFVLPEGDFPVTRCISPKMLFRLRIKTL